MAVYNIDGTLKIRCDTPENWGVELLEGIGANRILARGELAWVIGTDILKIGDGITKFKDLAPFKPDANSSTYTTYIGTEFAHYSYLDINNLFVTLVNSLNREISQREDHDVKFYSSVDEFPEDGSANCFYVDKSTNIIYRYDDTYIEVSQFHLEDHLVDNLTTADSNKVLSANQGKILKDEVDKKLNADSSIITELKSAAYKEASYFSESTHTHDYYALGTDGVADEAIKATNDSENNKIVDTYVTKAELKAQLTDKLAVANGIATLDENGIILSTQLPSYVDDVVEVESESKLPESGETSKIYVTKDTNLTYRWSGSGYIEISKSLALGETSSTAYQGDLGKATTDSLNSHLADKNNPHNVTKEQLGLSNVDNTKDSEKSVLSAVSATKDNRDQVIDSTYIKGIDISGRTVIITKGDGTSTTQQTQDTTYNVVTEATNGLMTSEDKTKLNTVSENANYILITTTGEGNAVTSVEQNEDDTVIITKGKKFSEEGHTHEYLSEVKIGDTFYASSGNTVTLPSYPTHVSEADSVPWTGVTGRPAEYTPAAHTHSYTDLTGSTETRNQAIVSNGTVDGWELKTLNNSAVGLGNVSNDQQLKALENAVTGNVIAFGDNYTVTDTGVTTDTLIDARDKAVASANSAATSESHAKASEDAAQTYSAAAASSLTGAREAETNAKGYSETTYDYMNAASDSVDSAEASATAAASSAKYAKESEEVVSASAADAADSASTAKGYSDNADSVLVQVTSLKSNVDTSVESAASYAGKSETYYNNLIGTATVLSSTDGYTNVGVSGSKLYYREPTFTVTGEVLTITT